MTAAVVSAFGAAAAAAVWFAVKPVFPFVEKPAKPAPAPAA
jgi:hypothetical protein